MDDNYKLKRFIEAQHSVYETALNEIKNGRKASHWMWYIFPQIEGLGRTAISKEYAVNSKNEALAYLNHYILGARLIEISREFLKIENLTAEQILGFPDVFKLKSSMSLFASIQKEEPVFKKILDKFYNGKVCEKTLKFFGKITWQSG